MKTTTFHLLAVLAASAPLTAAPAYRDGAANKDFFGFERYEFDLDGRNCYIIEPANPLPGKPWVWRARFDSKVFPAFDRAMLAAGYHVAKIDVGGLFGGPEAMKAFDRFHAELVTSYGFHSKPVLEGLSRGGLPIFNWSIANPDKVTCVYADAAVCDIKSWPGGMGTGKGWAAGWPQCLKASGITAEQAPTWKGNPVDRIHLLAKAGVPVVFVFGDADDVVPPAENALLMEKRYNAALPEGGTPMKMFPKPGVGHHPHGLEDPAPLVGFVQGAAATRRPPDTPQPTR